MQRMVNGSLVDLTTDEITEVQAEWAENAAPPVPPRIFSKRRFFLALTDAEYDTFASIEAQQKPKDRRAFAEATDLNEADDDWPQFLALMHAAYGEQRTAEILDAATL